MEGAGKRADAVAVPTAHARIQVFLIADIRGYTRFTAQRGDEAAAGLAARFAGITGDVVRAHTGRLLELRGDEALVVFASPRAALRAAAALQEAFIKATEVDPAVPLGVGIGVDVGEAVPLQRGYRGAALNLAARLCAQAGPGEILATAEVAHLAGQVQPLRYEPRPRVHAKGFPKPVAVVRVRDPAVDAARRDAFVRLVRAPAGIRRTAITMGALAAMLVASAIVAVITRTEHQPSVLSVAANSVAVIQPSSARLQNSTMVGTGPDQISYGSGSVWEVDTEDGTVERINPTTLTILARISVGDEPRAVAVSDPFVWVANSGEGTVSEINASVNRVVRTIRVGNGPSALAVTAGFVWVANRYDGTVTPIPLDSGRPRPPIRVGEEPDAVAANAGGVWVANFADDTLTRIDPMNERPDAPISVGGGPAGVTIAGADIWVANQTDGTASRVDAVTRTVTAVVQTGGGAGAVAAAARNIWVANESALTITQLDADTARVDRTIRLDNSPRALVVVRGRLWVTVRSIAAVAHRGGTLRVAVRLDSIDPANSYEEDAWALLSDVYDGLVGMRRVAGIDGLTPVPDLAVTLPRPTDGGRTYTFQLRPGIRYSSGGTVRASDVVRGLHRALVVGSNPNLTGPFAYLTGIVGASNCVYPHPASRCDLSRGVVADDAAGTVTVHLAAPDPDFLYKFALVNATVAAPGAPMRDVGNNPLPATGPYTFTLADRDHGRYVLTRNRYFHVWSQAAQPDGFPDRIVISNFGGPGGNAEAVERGAADLARVLTPAQLADAQVRRPSDVHTSVGTTIVSVDLNVTQPPFNDPHVRQAVNYAVDRARAVADAGGPVAYEVHCQVLPAGFPGYRPYCRYTADSSASGVWTAPDIARAQALVAASHTRGMRVDVWAPPDANVPGGREVASVVVRALAALGYRSRLRPVSDPVAYSSRIFDTRHPVQAAAFAWGTDYPTPDNYFTPLFSCAGLMFNNGGADVSHYCDHTVDRGIARALARAATAPSAATVGWALLDRKVTDAAPFVPVVVHRNVRLTSNRVGNFLANPQAAVLLDQLWVR